MANEAKSLALASGFHPSFLDFERGIRVGHLDPSQRITLIMKEILVNRHQVDMVCDRWGRGVYWQWICWVPKPNRDTKPLSHGYNFGSSKFFVTVDREDRTFKCGLQIERAPRKVAADELGVAIEKDWDWHVLGRALKTRAFQQQLRSLLDDGFRTRIGPFSEMAEFDEQSWSPEKCLRAMRVRDASEWGGFQLFWSMPEPEVHSMTGHEIIESITAVFDEVAPIMQECMYFPCLRVPEGV